MPALPHFYYHPRMAAYDFGPTHPLKPERLRRTLALLTEVLGHNPSLDPGLATREDVLAIHDGGYLDIVRELSSGERLPGSMVAAAGFRSLDNPPFPEMWEASLAYCGGAVRAAKAVLEGAPLALNIAGGLHHAMRAKAGGFCILNDPALACAVLRRRFERVAYVDIDLHHGDGVQALFYQDPTVLTCSIHQDGRTLFPGTGAVHETGAEFSSLNVPLAPHTSGDVWLSAFRRTILPALDRFQPEALVLQMGCDPHFLDPLGHLEVSTQEWLAAVRDLAALGLPMVACGGGGYHLPNVPRMWVAAILTLYRIEFADEIPAGIPAEWGMRTFADPPADLPSRGAGAEVAEAVCDHLEREVLPRIGGA